MFRPQSRLYQVLLVFLVFTAPCQGTLPSISLAFPEHLGLPYFLTWLTLPAGKIARKTHEVTPHWHHSFARVLPPLEWPEFHWKQRLFSGLVLESRTGSLRSAGWPGLCQFGSQSTDNSWRSDWNAWKKKKVDNFKHHEKPLSNGRIQLKGLLWLTKQLHLRSGLVFCLHLSSHSPSAPWSIYKTKL